MEAEFYDYEKNDKWRKIFRNVNSMSQTFPTKESRRVENKPLNRYMDVVPFDKTRVKLERNNLNYINASYVCVPAANRKYILTQGPLPNTSGHFWLMIWEQKSRAILMLSNLIECGGHKCHKYWPDGEAKNDVNEMIFADVSLKVQLNSTEKFNFYILRKFTLHDLLSKTSREILQFHYTSWPDFDLPKSSDSFLEFLSAVRKSNCLCIEKHGPTVIHCSAGIGRSGTFALVDSSLVIIEKNKCRDSINIIDILLELRTYRMGLIQTADQLRFSFLAIMEGSKHIAEFETQINNNQNNTSAATTPTKIKRLFGVNEEQQHHDLFAQQNNEIVLDQIISKSDNINNNENKNESNHQSSSSSSSSSSFAASSPPLTPRSPSATIEETPELRQRRLEREEKRQKTLEIINRIKRKQKETEERLKFNQKIFKYLKSISICCGVALFVGIIFFYKRRNSNSVLINYD